MQYTITMLDGEMQRMNINLEAIELYRRKDADYGERVKELEAATGERDTVRGQGEAMLLVRCRMGPRRGRQRRGTQ